MTQPAKVQEPSMEEILASIRRIIADDEAKPAVAEKPAGPAVKAPEAKAPVKNDIPPAAQTAAKAAPSPAKPAAPPPAPVASNSQDDIDALLNGLDEVTSAEEGRPPLPDGDVFELTDEMAVAMAPRAPPPKPAFHKIEPQDDIEFTEFAGGGTVPPRPANEPPPFDPPAQQILSHSTVSAVESAFHTLAN